LQRSLITLIGAIIGDVIGSVFETYDNKTTDFKLFAHASRFTDDTVLTAAVADAILQREKHSNKLIDARQARKLYARKIKAYGRRYPNAGYGQMFHRWLDSDSLRGYGSYGNGSAMRVSPIGFAFDDLETVLTEARLSAVVTHNHREGIKGAQAIAGAVFLARTGAEKESIKNFHEHIQIRSEQAAGRHPPNVHIRRFVPAFGAAGYHRVSGIPRFRGCDSKGGLLGRR
jgi:ADP-ribosylglycohydrolase